MNEIEKKVAIITGATGNLGKAIVEKFLSEGMILALFGRSITKLEKLVDKNFNSTTSIGIFAVDSTNSSSIEVGVNKTLDRFGKIDVLVNTVGGYHTGEPLHKTAIETWNYMMDLNAKSVFMVCKAVIPHMLLRKGGKIVNVSARPGLIGRANTAAYSVSKSAVLRLTESMSAELKYKNINVNCIIPGTMSPSLNTNKAPAEEDNLRVSTRAISEVIYFLISENADAIHGAAIPVYGLT